jgi:hypothetical protein
MDLETLLSGGVQPFLILPELPVVNSLARIERWSILNRNPFSILLASHPGWKQKEDSYGYDNVISYCFGRHFGRRGRLGILSLEGLKAYGRRRKPRFAKGNTAARVPAAGGNGLGTQVASARRKVSRACGIVIETIARAEIAWPECGEVGCYTTGSRAVNDSSIARKVTKSERIIYGRQKQKPLWTPGLQLFGGAR